MRQESLKADMLVYNPSGFTEIRETRKKKVSCIIQSEVISEEGSLNIYAYFITFPTTHAFITDK